MLDCAVMFRKVAPKKARNRKPVLIGADEGYWIRFYRYLLSNWETFDSELGYTSVVFSNTVPGLENKSF